MKDDRQEEQLRTQRRLARAYRRRGYKVMEQPRDEALPPFLHGFSPDLVVMKEDDRAVVEIRTRESLVGSNEFAELARVIAAHPGWRLELNSLGERRTAAEDVPAESLGDLLAAGLSAIQSGQCAFALIFLVSVLDELLRDAALRHGVRVQDRSAPTIIDELAFAGIIEGATADLLDWAWRERRAVVHGQTSAGDLSSSDVGRLLAACRELRSSARLEAA